MKQEALLSFFSTEAQILTGFIALVAVYAFYRSDQLKKLLIGQGEAILEEQKRI